MDDYRQEKVQKFEEFVDRQLKLDLVRAITERPDSAFLWLLDLDSMCEFAWYEALNYLLQLEEKTASQIEEYARLIASIRTQIKLILQACLSIMRVCLNSSNIRCSKSKIDNLEGKILYGFESVLQGILRS